MLVAAVHASTALAAAAGASAAACGAPPADAGAPPGAYPDLAVLTVPAVDSFTARADGTYVVGATPFPLRAVARTFYESHADDYDFLVVWSDFHVTDWWAFNDVLKNDIGGIGLAEYWQWAGLSALGDDQSAMAGSAGRLQGITFMNGPAAWAGTPEFSEQELLTNELGHRWCAYLNLPGSGDPWAFVDDVRSHWSIVANMGNAAALAYGLTHDNGDGTFTAQITRPLTYTPWELYAMGLYDAAALADPFYVTGATAFTPPQTPWGAPWTADTLAATTPVTFNGTRVDVPKADVFAALGPRTPPFGAAPTSFRAAFVVLCRPRAPCGAATLAWVDAQRLAWPDTFTAATGGRATFETAL
ncbi:MAG TPA: hypothetical protein VG389_08410 [Myxococcota bacterium]|jgi:hypothetical protein|nr:hypothetical protein [Myxococcota bacterium]